MRERNVAVVGSGIAIAVALISLIVATVKNDVFGEAYRSSATQPIIFVSSETATSSVYNAFSVGTSTPVIAASSTFPNVKLAIDTELAGYKGLVVRGVTGQTANLFEGQYATSTIVWYVDPDGNMFASGTISGSAVGTSTFVNLSVTGNTRLGDALTDKIALSGRITSSVFASSTLFIGVNNATTTVNLATNTTSTLRGQGTCSIWRDVSTHNLQYVSIINGVLTVSSSTCE
jgi:hypothetical protein